MNAALEALQLVTLRIRPSMQRFKTAVSAETGAALKALFC